MTKDTEIVIKSTVKHILWTVGSILVSFMITFGTMYFTISRKFDTKFDAFDEKNTNEHLQIFYTLGTINGQNGENGQNGTNGKNGVNGVNGIQGIQGVQGIQGIKGNKGSDCISYK